MTQRAQCVTMAADTCTRPRRGAIVGVTADARGTRGWFLPYPCSGTCTDYGICTESTTTDYTYTLRQLTHTPIQCRRQSYRFTYFKRGRRERQRDTDRRARGCHTQGVGGRRALARLCPPCVYHRSLSRAGGAREAERGARGRAVGELSAEVAAQRSAAGSRASCHPHVCAPAPRWRDAVWRDVGAYAVHTPHTSPLCGAYIRQPPYVRL